MAVHKRKAVVNALVVLANNGIECGAQEFVKQ